MVINHPKDHLLKMYAKKKNISGKKHQKKRKKTFKYSVFFFMRTVLKAILSHLLLTDPND